MKLTEDLKKRAQMFRTQLLTVTGRCQAADKLHISDIKPGQLWKLSYGDDTTHEAMFVVVSSLPFTERGNQETAVRIVPVFCSPAQKSVCAKTDLVIAGKESVTGVSSLLEWWNERPVKLSQLNTLFGKIPDQQLKRLKLLLKTEPVLEPSKVDVRLFREEEKARGALVSSAYFDELSLATSPKQEEKSWLATVHEWIMQNFCFEELKPAYYCSEPGFSPEFKHCRTQIIRIIEEINSPNEIAAFTTLAGMRIIFGCKVSIKLVLFDKNHNELITVEPEGREISLHHDQLDSWGEVAGFKFIL